MPSKLVPSRRILGRAMKAGRAVTEVRGSGSVDPHGEVPCLARLDLGLFYALKADYV